MEQKELIDRLEQIIVDTKNLLDDLYEGNFDMSDTNDVADVSNLATEFTRLADELEEGL